MKEDNNISVVSDGSYLKIISKGETFAELKISKDMFEKLKDLARYYGTKLFKTNADRKLVISVFDHMDVLLFFQGKRLRLDFVSFLSLCCDIAKITKNKELLDVANRKLKEC